MQRFKPLIWISIGLVCLTVTFMLTGNLLLDPVPSEAEQEFKYRATLSEALAVQYSKLVENEQDDVLRSVVHTLVLRNQDVLSASLIQSDGTVVATSGNHWQHWVQPAGEQSTIDHVQVPIFSGDSPWGTLQIAFRPVRKAGLGWLLSHPLLHFMAFVAVVGFLGYLFFMKRTLKQLDPSAVIPDRVKKALDVLVDGVVLVDGGESIVLTNAAFAEGLGRDPSELLGGSLSKLPWKPPHEDEVIGTYPWTQALRERRQQTGVRIDLPADDGSLKNYLVNSAPILDEHGDARGILTSFSDVTALNEATANLEKTYRDLQESQTKVLRQNEELAQLAMRDPLTGCLNRRGLLSTVVPAFQNMVKEGTVVSCIMSDIDHFKTVNDTHGHAIGDQVINVVARTLSGTTRPNDFVCRYGGEEFCVILPGATTEQAAVVAERIRRKVETQCGPAVREVPGLQVTSSFGVSSTVTSGKDLHALIDQADKSLYTAKQGGRNLVVTWSGEEQEAPGLDVSEQLAKQKAES